MIGCNNKVVGKDNWVFVSNYNTEKLDKGVLAIGNYKIQF